MLLELFFRMTVSPYLRSGLLKLFGAKIGKNVRIYEVQLFNLEKGFSNLIVRDDVHIGMGCRLDLSAAIKIEKGVTLSPGVTILTHSDPGSHHNSPICQAYPPYEKDVQIFEHTWIGANTTILAGSVIQEKSVVGAGSLVKGKIGPDSVYAGSPAKKIKYLNQS